MREKQRIKIVLFRSETFHLHPTKAFNVFHVRAVYWFVHHLIKQLQTNDCS